MQPYRTENDSADGPSRLVLVGPPGTGKTTTALRDFIIPAIESGDSRRIKACSFSVAAANELRTRCIEQLGFDADDLRTTFTTIHAECLRLYKTQRNPDAKLYNAATGGVTAIRRFAETPDPPGYMTKEHMREREAVANAWALIRSKRLDMDSREARLMLANAAARTGSDIDTATDLIMRFQAEKADAGAIDFTDMLEHGLDMAPNDLDLLLLDEAQDCSRLQWDIFLKWAHSSERAVIIGDPDQAIYGWMGAEIGKLEALMADKWESRYLEHSWRVPLTQHGAARSIILRNAGRVDAPYSPAERDGTLKRASLGSLAPDLRQIVKTGQSALVLCRTNEMVGKMRKELLQLRIPCQGSPASGAAARAVLDLCRWEECDPIHLNHLVGRLMVKPLKPFLGTKKAAKDAAADYNGAGWPQFLDPDVWRKENELALLQQCKLSGWTPETAIEAYTDFGGDVLTRDPDVKVMTMHRSKGLEAPLVVVYNAMNVPAARAYGNMSASIEDVQAERRLIYVAMTRSSERTAVVDGPLPYPEITEALAGAEVAPF